MKIKYFFPILVALIMGFILGYYIYEKYDNKNKIQTVFNNSNELYFIQLGVYKNKDNMENKMKSLSYYIYSKEDDLYHAFGCITHDKNNLTKIKGYYNSIKYNIYEKKYQVDNDGFLTVLDQYDELLKQTNDDKTIEAICSQVLSKYEEMVVDNEN